MTARGEAALARLGGGTEARPRRLSDGEFSRKITGIWLKHPRYRARGRSTIRLPSGRELAYDDQAGEVVK